MPTRAGERSESVGGGLGCGMGGAGETVGYTAHTRVERGHHDPPPWPGWREGGGVWRRRGTAWMGIGDWDWERAPPHRENCRLGRHRRGTASNLSYKGYGGTDRGPTAARGPAGHRRRPSRGPSGTQAGTREEREAAGGETSACHWRWGRGRGPVYSSGSPHWPNGGMAKARGTPQEGLDIDGEGVYTAHKA